jgi:hypothetical protein
LEVPVADPAFPVLVIQVTLATATLSLAVPEIDNVGSVVLTVVPDGAAIVRVGAVVSFTEVLDWRVTVTVCETVLELFAAVTVIEFAPVTNGTYDMFQFVPFICATPDAPFADQVTVVPPVPPETEPLSAMVEAVPGAWGACTVSVKGASVGEPPVGVPPTGVEGAPSCGAYIVRIAALSPAASVLTIL